MPSRQALVGVLAAFALFTQHTFAAGVLQNGNSQLPSCGTSCGILNQAAQACGGTNTESQTIWNCFCQSGYLTNLNGVCSDTCSNPSDQQQIATWYKSNCGNDYGASEHPGSVSSGSGSSGGSGNTAGSGGAAATTTTTSAAGSGSTSILGSGGNSGVTVILDNSADWWPTHYKWVIMIIVIAIGLCAIGFFAHWLKRRYNRKQDQLTGGFNAGITSRSADAPMSMTSRTGGGPIGPFSNNGSGVFEPADSGRNSPSIMPVGHGYARSSDARSITSNYSRPTSYHMASTNSRAGGVSSPLARDHSQTPPLGMSANAQGKQPKRVMVRERSTEGPETPADER